MGGICVAFFVIYLIGALVNSILEARTKKKHYRSPNRQTYTPPTPTPTRETLNARVKISQDEYQGESLRIVTLCLEGSIEVPRDNYPCTVVISVLDISAETKSVYSNLDGNEIVVEEDLVIPYENSVFTDAGFCIPCPLEYFHCAQSGPRRLKFDIKIKGRSNNRLVARTDCIYDHFENATGYEEIALQARNCELHLATLAVAVAMSDRKFETEEGDEIREFFKDRIDDSDHQLKKDVSKRLKSTLKAIREGGKSASQFVESACSRLNAEGSTVCRQSAYEICARITACDNEVDQREHRALSFIAKSLNLDGDFVREVNDRFLKISMFKNATDEQLVGMPSGLTVQEKIAFINREYKKWRSRVTHSDPKVVSEANQRLDRLTKLRNKINKR